MNYTLQVPGAKASGLLEVTSPYNDDWVASIETIDEKGAECALTNAERLFNNRQNWLTVNQRIIILEQTVILMRKHFDRLVHLAVLEGGKPLMDTRIEVERAIDGIKNCITCMTSEHGTEIPMQINGASSQRLAFTHKEPIGVVVAISAFNHPLNLIVHQVGPAIATGCPIIIKPAADTPVSCFEFVKLLREAGLPDEWCQAVAVNDTKIAETLATDHRVNFFSFIGSPAIGWMLHSKLSAGTRSALEHGGAAPVIVAADADLDQILPVIVKGGFYHAGQVCVSVQRIFVHNTLLHEFADRLTGLVANLIVGDPLLADTEVGPLIRHRETHRIAEWVDKGITEGSEILIGGNMISDALFQPTILLNPSQQSLVSQREIFGPVVCLYAYNAIDDAIELANSLPYAFQAAIMSRNIDTIMYAHKHLKASAMMVNDHTAFRVDWMPFAGLGQSGYGTGGIPYTYRDMQIEKMLVMHSPSL